jgi:hypothetical protein
MCVFYHPDAELPMDAKARHYYSVGSLLPASLMARAFA